MPDVIDFRAYRRQTKMLLMRTQSGICPLCHQRPVSDLHEIVVIRGHQKGSKYRLEDDYALAVYAPGNTLLLCNVCNVNTANGLSIDKMLQIKMSQPGVKPEEVVQAMRNLATFSKNARLWIPATVEFNQTTYQIL